MLLLALPSFFLLIPSPLAMLQTVLCVVPLFPLSEHTGR